MLWPVDAVPLLPQHDILRVVPAILHASLQQLTSIQPPLEVRHKTMRMTMMIMMMKYKTNTCHTPVARIRFIKDDDGDTDDDDEVQHE